MKKGISPLIATALLVLIVGAIGAFIFAFYEDFIGRKSDETGEMNSLNNYCLYGVKLNIEKICDDAGNLTLFISNEGIGNVSKFKFIVYNEDGTDHKMFSLSSSLDGLSSRYYKINSPYHSWDISKIIVVPFVVVSEGVSGECNGKEIEIEDIPDC